MACSLSLCNSASAILEKGARGEEEKRKEKQNTRCSQSPKEIHGHLQRGFARTLGGAPALGGR